MGDKALEEAMQELMPELKLEYAINSAENHREVTVDARVKNKKMKKMEEAMRELMVKVKRGDTLNTDENHDEVNVDADMKKKKKKMKKNKRHAIPECMNKDQKPLEENMQDVLVILKPEVAQQAVESHAEVNVEQKNASRKNRQQELNSLEPSEGNAEQKYVNRRNKKKKLKSLEIGEDCRSQVKRIDAQLISENHEKLSSPKKKMKRNKGTIIHEHNVTHEKKIDKYDLELLLPVEKELKTSKGTAENLVRKAEDKLTVRKVKTPSYVLGLGVSSKQLVGTSGESSRDLPGIVKKGHFIDEENKDSSATNFRKEEIRHCESMRDNFQGGFEEECAARHVPTSPKRSLASVIRKKLLILDLNGLLVDVVPTVPPGYKADKKIGRKAVFKRPFCDDFLKFCFERFDVGVWSSRIKKNLDDMVDFLMGDMKSRLLFCWSQSHCTMTGLKTIEDRKKPLVLKELKKLWEKHDRSLPWEKGHYNESNTLLLDDSPYKALRNPPYSAIFPFSYGFRDANDKSLGPEGDIRLYLEGLSLAEDVQKYVAQHPFGQRAITDSNPNWGFYRRVIGIQSSNITHIRF